MKLLLCIPAILAVLFWVVFLLCIGLCWLMGRARKMFPHVSDEAIEMAREVTNVDL
jgi:hypothetical protein